MGISKKSWTGVAKEATPGTAMAAPTLYVPTKTTFKGGKKREYLNEERGDRNSNYGVVDSIRQSAVNIKGPWYNDALGYFLYGAMGVDTPTQPNAGTAPTVWKHSFSLGDIPPSFTMFRSLDTKAYYVPYSVVEKFKLNFASEGKLLEMEADMLGLYAQPIASPPTPSYSSLLPFAGYLPTITLASGVSTDIIELALEFDQKVTLWYPANGSQDFITVYFGERKLTGSFTARFDNTTIYDKWRNNTNDSLQIDFQGANIASTYNQELNINIPVITYDDAEHDLGKDNVLIKTKFTALATTTQFFSAFIQNTITSYAS